MLKYILVTLVLFNIVLSSPSCLKYLRVRSYDGSCNSLLNKDLGKGNSYFKNGPEGREPYIWQRVPKLDPLPTYDTVEEWPSDGPRGNARNISNLLTMRHDNELTDENNHSVFSAMFGQFVNHDLENTQMIDSHIRFQTPLAVYIKDPNDYVCLPTQERPFPHPFRCGPNDTALVANIRLSNGTYLSNSEFKVFNNATSFLDLSHVYGLTEEFNEKLRLKEGGKLKYTPSLEISVTDSGSNYTTTLYNLLPTYSDVEIPIDITFVDAGNPLQFFSAGDERVNENMALTFFHTLWLREHNKVCDELMNKNILWRLLPKLFDEVIFQAAREITIAKYQHIIYNEYFPSVYGQYFANKIGEYKGYNIAVDPTTSLVFSNAAFRYGHFNPRPYFALDGCGRSIQNNRVADDQTLKQMYIGFQNPFPTSLTPAGRIADTGGLENIARGLINEKTAPNGLTSDNTLRNFTSSWGVVDLITFDIARARYNDLPNYQRIRKHYHQSGNLLVDNIYGNDDCPSYLESSNQDDPIDCFLYITSDLETAQKLKNVYRKINLIDAIIGLQAEDHVEGTSFGRTQGNIIADQFKRSRDGDRFFYRELIKKNRFSQPIKQEILSTKMVDILKRNLNDDFKYVENPFISPENYRELLSQEC